MKYGARHLKRAIERSLVHPLSNLIASDQVHGGDLIRIDFDADADDLALPVKEAEQMAAYAMVQMMEIPPASQAAAATASPFQVESTRGANAKSQRIR